MYTPYDLVQNRLERTCKRFSSNWYTSLSANSPRFLATLASDVFCVSNVAGVRIKDVAGSVETDTNVWSVVNYSRYFSNEGCKHTLRKISFKYF